MPKGSSKSTAAIQRLLEERRQYEAWLARLDAAGDATPTSVRTRVKADYQARLIQRKETQAAERLSETELRHAVGEYDEAQWSQVHKDALAELVSVREELQSIDADIAQLEELDRLVQHKAAARPAGEKPRVGPPPKPRPEAAGEPRFEKKAPVDELAFLKSVTEDEKGAAPSPRRASGSQYQPVIPGDPPRGAPMSAHATPTAQTNDEPDPEQERTLKCKECGRMNLPTEWYCEGCGAELAAL